jgi:AhpD family alkylhydroperoxidase
MKGENLKKFNRRIYPGVGAFLADFKAMMSQRHLMRPLMRGESIEAAFRERLMLAVTAVNGCRYCSFAHARQALAQGIDEEEIKALQEGILKDSPKEELPALLYAQHWAETAGSPDPAARQHLVEIYGEDRLVLIELALRAIQMGNLLGNTFDFLLFRLSFGHLGSPRFMENG